MAYLQLFPHGDREIRDLPFYCMRCGAAAATIVRQRFSTAHYFVTVHVPMCNKHRFHWLLSALLVVGSIFGSTILIEGILIGFAGRLTYTNMIHSRPVLGKAFLRRFKKFEAFLKDVPEAQKQNAGWRAIGQPPTHAELQDLWAADRAILGIKS